MPSATVASHARIPSSGIRRVTRRAAAAKREESLLAIERMAGREGDEVEAVLVNSGHYIEMEIEKRAASRQRRSRIGSLFAAAATAAAFIVSYKAISPLGLHSGEYAWAFPTAISFMAGAMIAVPRRLIPEFLRWPDPDGDLEAHEREPIEAAANAAWGIGERNVYVRSTAVDGSEIAQTVPYSTIERVDVVSYGGARHLIQGAALTLKNGQGCFLIDEIDESSLPLLDVIRERMQ